MKRLAVSALASLSFCAAAQTEVFGDGGLYLSFSKDPSFYQVSNITQTKTWLSISGSFSLRDLPDEDFFIRIADGGGEKVFSASFNVSFWPLSDGDTLVSEPELTVSTEGMGVSRTATLTGPGQYFAVSHKYDTRTEDQIDELVRLHISSLTIGSGLAACEWGDCYRPFNIIPRVSFSALIFRPVPEPSTIVLVAAGLVVAGIAGKGRAARNK